MSADLNVPPPMPSPQDSDDHDLMLALDLIDKMKAAETNGGLLGAVLLYRFELRKRYKADAEAAIASLQARLEAAERRLDTAAGLLRGARRSIPLGIWKDTGLRRRIDAFLTNAALDAATQEKPAAPSEGSQG